MTTRNTGNMRPGNERGWKRRLELLKTSVLDAVENYKIASSQEQRTAGLSRLSCITQRFVEEIRLYTDRMTKEEIEEYTHIQLETELLTSTPLSAPPPIMNNQTRLPKLQLPTFRGNVIKWTEFYDRFHSSVDTKNISYADKLTYLQASLEGEALATIRGLDITNENYNIAMDLLKQRYGKPGTVLDAHYTALMGLKKSSSNGKDCLETFNQIERHLRVLKAMGEDIGHNNLKTIILSKFPDDLIYELKTKIKTDEETVHNIRKELEHLITARTTTTRDTPPTATIESLHVRDMNERKRIYSSMRNEHKNRKENFSDIKNKGYQYNKKRRVNPCIFCKRNDHFNDQCTKVTSVKERKNLLKGRCYICLGNHMAKDCFSRKSCHHCKGNHNSAICYKRNSTKKHNIKTKATTMHTTSQDKLSHPITLLQTAVVKIQGRKYRVLFDTGSQRSYITSEAASRLNLQILEDTILTVYTFGSERAQEIESPTTEIELKGIRIRLNIVPFITAKVEHPKIQLSTEDKKNLVLADDGSLGTHIDMLIGNDYYNTFMCTERIQYDDHLYLLKSVFGWIWTGIQKENFKSEREQLLVATYIRGEKTGRMNEIDLPLRDSFAHKLWDLETIGITDCPKTTRDDQAVEEFNKSVQFTNERYWIKWPWTEYPPNLPVNYKLSLGRLVGLIRRLDESTLKEYNTIIQEQLQAGIIEITNPPVDETEQTMPPIHYLPHHAVKHPGKKARIVYDASSKTKGTNSLNDCMHKGPLLLEDLVGLLLRFRTHKYGIMADIEKAFLQLCIQESDRNVTRFLWLKDITQRPTCDNLLHLRFCRVPFGIVCSPFLLAIVLKHHLKNLNTETSKIVAQDLYVDNLMTGKDTTDECNQFFKEVRKIFQSLSMNIREWYTNNKELTKSIDRNLIGKEDKIANSLGMCWKLDQDTLHLNIKLEQTDYKINKREVLKQIASIFDPCGFASPLLLKPKLFLQNLWKEKFDWDSILPDQLQEEWKEIRKDLEKTKEIEIQRWYGVHEPLNGKDSKQELHVFTDASTDAYAAAIYLKIQQKKDIKTTLLMSKSRLTPLKDRTAHTIPRLELMGVLIGCRLLNYVKKSLNIDITAQYIWTDSQIVLCWLKSSKVLPPFVITRLQEIKKIQNTEFRYVPTKLNPADLATRPCSGISDQNLWKNGPNFLKQEKLSWPAQIKEHSMLTNCENVDLEFIKKLQSKHFPEEMTKTTNLTRTLGLFLEDGVLRCRGRFKNTNWTEGQKYPILLPKDTEFTQEIIEKKHKKLHHAGVSQTLANIRLNFWIPHGRSQVQKVLKHCKECKKYGGKPYVSPSAPALPQERVNITLPFTFVGIDYLGPLYVTEENKFKKLWVCLFTCLVVRAIHLEVVDNLSAEECLLALRRFTAERRVPKKILSDNAANFRLTSEVLKSEYCSDNKIEWQFIPELAPWFGGAYERMVGLVKHCLKRTIDKQLLTTSQLTTIIKEIETVVNTRPLTTVSADLEHVLTPADFLCAGGLLTTSETSEILEGNTSMTSVKRNLIEGWKKGQNTLQEFIDMFQNQYLSSLRERSLKTNKVCTTPKVGDVVQIKESSPRVKWKVGKICQLIESRDGLVRVAVVQLKNGGTLRRSITHLYPLEIDAEEKYISENIKPTELKEIRLQDNKEVKESNENGIQSNEVDEEVREEEVRVEEEIRKENVNLNEEVTEQQIRTDKNKDETCEEVRVARKASKDAKMKIAQWLKLLLVNVRNNTF